MTQMPANARTLWQSVATTLSMLTALVTLGTLIYSQGRAAARLEAVERDVGEVRVVVKDIEKSMANQTANVQVLAAQMTNLHDRLSEIERRQRRGTN